MGGMFSLRGRSDLEIETLAVPTFNKIGAANFVFHYDLLLSITMLFTIHTMLK